jgi:glycosyltransferase involved in cell wall biosynthesis
MTDPIRVVHLTTTDMSLDWLLRPQLEAFTAAGYEVIGASAPGDHVDALRASGIRHEAVQHLTRANQPGRDLLAALELARLFRRLRPDIVHTHNPKPGILGRIVARLCRVPLVVNTQHGLYAQPHDRRLRRWAVYGSERLAAAFGHVELVQNPEDVDTLVHTLHIPRRKVRLLGNGIDLVRFDPAAAAPSRDRVRAEWGVAPGELVVGAVGRLVAEKGFAEILEACARLREQGRPIRLVVVGPTDDDKADRLGDDELTARRTDGVVFTGRRDDMPDCYAAMDCFVTASWREGFPRAAMEAAAMGLAIVATDIRGCRQVVHHDRNGLLVPLHDVDALTAALDRLVTDDDLRRRLGAAGPVAAAAEFDQRRVVERTLDAYRLLGDRRATTVRRRRG